MRACGPSRVAKPSDAVCAGDQLQLVSAVANASSSPIIVVLLSGSSVDMSAVLDMGNVGAVLWAGYPGQSGGQVRACVGRRAGRFAVQHVLTLGSQAIADVLLGSYAPAGRLPFTMYGSGYATDMPMMHMGMRAENGLPGRSYRFYTGKPVLPFAFGLSYTSWKFSVAASGAADVAPNRLPHVQLARVHSVEAGGALEISASDLRAAVAQGGTLVSSQVVATLLVAASNTGSVDSDVSVVAFVSPPSPGVAGAPLKWVVGYDRVHVSAGSSAKVGGGRLRA